jgi:hypothetical protein
MTGTIEHSKGGTIFTGEGVCKQLFGDRTPEYHHILAAALGGDNSLSNLLVICPPCHRAFTKVENKPIFRAKRIEEKRKGWRVKRSQWPKRSMSAENYAIHTGKVRPDDHMRQAEERARA